MTEEKVLAEIRRTDRAKRVIVVRVDPKIREEFLGFLSGLLNRGSPVDEYHIHVDPGTDFYSAVHSVREFVRGVRWEERTIRAMEVGEIGYTLPWAIRDGCCNLIRCGSYPVYKEPRGTANMPIKCTAKGWVYSIGGHDYYLRPAKQPEFIRYISEMKAGDVGYALPSALDNLCALLNEDFRIVQSKTALRNMRVECLEPGRYCVCGKTVLGKNHLHKPVCKPKPVKELIVTNADSTKGEIEFVCSWDTVEKYELMKGLGILFTLDVARAARKLRVGETHSFFAVLEYLKAIEAETAQVP